MPCFNHFLFTRTHARTHSFSVSILHTHPRQDGTGRTQDLARHIFPPRNGLIIKWNKAECARLAPGTGTSPPPLRRCPPPPTSGPDLIHRSSLARSSHMARRSSSCCSLQPTSNIRATAFQGWSLWTIGKLNGCPGPKFHPNLGTFPPLLQSKRLNIQLTTSDAPCHMRMHLTLIRIPSTSRISAYCPTHYQV